MQDQPSRKTAKFLFLSALLASGMTVGLALTVGAADEPAAPADAPSALAQPAPQPHPRLTPGDFAKKRAQFLEDTKDLRRQIAVAKAAMKALMRSTQPDVDLAQRFAGELFDLREQLRAKEAESGLPPMMGGKPSHPCQGPGMAFDPMGCCGHGHPGMQGGCMGHPRHGKGHGHHAPMMGCMGHGPQDHHGPGAPGTDCGCGGR